MFEEEIGTLIDTIARRTIAGGESIALRDVLAAEIPHPVKAFFRADVEALLASELRRERSATRFFYDHPEVQSLQSQINAILVLHYAYDRAEFLRQVDETVHMMVNFLVRPEWTLTSVLFETNESVSSQALVRLLRYFGPYEYYRDVLTRYIDDKQITSLGRAEFASLLRKVDASFVRRKTGDELARVLLPLYEFMDYPFRTGTNALPVKALIRFFDDKGLPQVVRRLEEERAKSTVALTRADLALLLEDMRRTAGAFEVGVPDAPQAAAASPAAAAEPVAPRAVTAGVTGILASIGDNDRRRFIIRIFKQNEDAFTEALQSMASLPSWEEASARIDQIYAQNQIDPYSYDAERFSGVLFQHYHRSTP
jgi:hypothetical protein